LDRKYYFADGFFFSSLSYWSMSSAGFWWLYVAGKIDRFLGVSHCLVSWMEHNFQRVGLCPSSVVAVGRHFLSSPENRKRSVFWMLFFFFKYQMYSPHFHANTCDIDKIIICFKW
jgi:hypothetical protein